MDPNDSKVFWVETDLEPDDVQALLALREFGVIDVVVAGGSTEPVKVAESAARFMSLLELKEMPLIRTGFADNHVFSDRGKEHSNGTAVRGFTAGPVVTDEQYVDDFETWVLRCYAKMATPVFVSLKPPHELFRNFERINKDTLKRVDAICHMGFNSREVLDAHPGSHSRYMDMLCRFNSVRVFTRKSIDGDCSVGRDDGRGIFETLWSRIEEPFVKAHHLLMFYWNAKMTNELIEKSKRLVNDFLAARGKDKNARQDPEIDRCLDLALKMSDTSRQFLLADQCAVIAALSDSMRKNHEFKARLQFDDKNNVIVDASDDSKCTIYSFSGVKRDEMIDCMNSLFKNI